MTAPMVVAIDPGLTTGVAAYNAGKDPVASQIVGRMEVYTLLEPVLLAGPCILVVESFSINGRTAQKSQQLDPLYIIGHLEAVCFQHNVPFVLQAPAMAKAFATDAKLKAAGWWVPGQDHARDALRHLMTFLCTHRTQWPELGGDALLARIVKGL